MKILYILLVIVIFAAGCRKDKYETYYLPDNCFKTNLVLKNLNLHDFHSIKFNSSYIKILTDNSINYYYKIIGIGKEYII